MIFEEMLREEKQEGQLEGRIEGRIEGKKEDILEILEELGEIPEELKNRIVQTEELEKLKTLLKMAVRADSIPAFEKEAETYL